MDRSFLFSSGCWWVKGGVDGNCGAVCEKLEDVEYAELGKEWCSMCVWTGAGDDAYDAFVDDV